jgi:hypothetical protein
MGNNTNLYDLDYYGWILNQTDLLKNGILGRLDIENLVEEISSLGDSQRSKLESFLEILLMHLLKIEYQKTHYTRSWDLSVAEAQRQVKKVLKKNQV